MSAVSTGTVVKPAENRHYERGLEDLKVAGQVAISLGKSALNLGTRVGKGALTIVGFMHNKINDGCEFGRARIQDFRDFVAASKETLGEVKDAAVARKDSLVAKYRETREEIINKGKELITDVQRSIAESRFEKAQKSASASFAEAKSAIVNSGLSSAHQKEAFGILRAEIRDELKEIRRAKELKRTGEPSKINEAREIFAGRVKDGFEGLKEVIAAELARMQADETAQALKARSDELRHARKAKHGQVAPEGVPGLIAA